MDRVAMVEAVGRQLYLDLIKRSLTNLIYGGDRADAPFDRQVRAEGRDWPSVAHTMIGLARLDNIQMCAEDVLARDVAGDFVETGVWRGGATILMRAVLKAYAVRDRRVWVADSFAGLPPPDPTRYPVDAGDPHHTYPQLAVPLAEVEENFARYGLLDDQVRFLPGWFRDTLPTAPIERLALLRLDGDMYESTMQGMTYLYPRLAVGGYVIVDDYGTHPGCAQAITDYRRAAGIQDEIRSIDWAGVYWRRST